MNSRSSKEKKDLKALDEMIEEITVDAYVDHEQLWAFRQVFEDSSEYLVAVSEVVFPVGSAGARYIAAYRRWLNIGPVPARIQPPSGRKRQPKATTDDLDLSQPVELIVLSVKERAVRCRLSGSGRDIILRPSRLRNMVPGNVSLAKYGKNIAISMDDCRPFQKAGIWLVKIQPDLRTAYG